MKLKLAPYVDAAFRGPLLSLGFGSLRKLIENPGLQKAIIQISHMWKQPLTRIEMQNKILNNSDFELKAYATEAIDILCDGSYLIEPDTFNPTERNSRNNLFYNLNGISPHLANQNINSKHVCIIGAGGIGNYVASSLIGFGIGKITIVDDDLIEASNLSRQIMFTEKDIGHSKVEKLVNALHERNSKTKIHGIEKKIESHKSFFDLPHSDLIILSADSPSNICYFANKYSIQTGTPFLNVGYVMDVAVWGPFVIPGKTGCMRCQQIFASQNHVDSELQTKLLEISADFRPPSVGPINMLSAAMATLDAIRFLGEFGEIASKDKRVGIWTHSLKIETQNCSKNRECKECGHL